MATGAYISTGNAYSDAGMSDNATLTPNLFSLGTTLSLFNYQKQFEIHFADYNDPSVSASITSVQLNLYHF
jgi:hypothetical protein